VQKMQSIAGLSPVMLIPTGFHLLIWKNSWALLKKTPLFDLKTKRRKSKWPRGVILGTKHQDSYSVKYMDWRFEKKARNYKEIKFTTKTYVFWLLQISKFFLNEIPVTENCRCLVNGYREPE
jgi:hypothetical protein